MKHIWLCLLGATALAGCSDDNTVFVGLASEGPGAMRVLFDDRTVLDGARTPEWNPGEVTNVFPGASSAERCERSGQSGLCLTLDGRSSVHVSFQAVPETSPRAQLRTFTALTQDTQRCREDRFDSTRFECAEVEPGDTISLGVEFVPVSETRSLGVGLEAAGSSVEAAVLGQPVLRVDPSTPRRDGGGERGATVRFRAVTGPDEVFEGWKGDCRGQPSEFTRPLDRDLSCIARFRALDPTAPGLCAADERVLGGACVPCEADGFNEPGDDPTGTDTTCDFPPCGPGEHVIEGVCVTCPAPSENRAGDLPDGPDTSCDGLDRCATDERVEDGVCVPCPEGDLREEGDDAGGPDTSCAAPGTRMVPQGSGGGMGPGVGVDAGTGDPGPAADGGTEPGIVPDGGVVADGGFVPDSGLVPDGGVVPDTGVVPDAGEIPDTGVVADVGVTPDTGVVPDAGVVPDTGVVPDAGVATDTGVGPSPDVGTDADGGLDLDGGRDAGPLDSGPPDMGVLGQGEGESCEALPCAPGLSCVSSDAIDSVCLALCTDDVDCAGSALTPPASFCSGGGYCAQAIVGEGELATVGSTIIEGCAPDLLGFGTDRTNELACARACASRADCPTREIPFCNVNGGGLDDSTIPGVCSRRPGYHGEACSSRHIVDGCTLDRAGQGTVLCSDVWGEIDDGLALDGVCLGHCGDADDDPATPFVGCVTPPVRSDDPTPSCLTADDNGMPLFSENPNKGVCSDDCGVVANTCEGTVTSCWPLYPDRSIEFRQCLFPAAPFLPIWHTALGTPTPDLSCLGRYNRCPPDAYCARLSSAEAVCIYGCGPPGTVGGSGCEDKVIDDQDDLDCVPLPSGSGEWLCIPPT